MAVDDLGERLAEDVLHDHPVIAARIAAEVVEVDEVGVLEVEAVGDAAELGVGVAAEKLEGDLLAPIGDREVDLAEAALADAALEGVAVKRPLPGAVGELQSGHRKPRRRWERLSAVPRVHGPLNENDSHHGCGY